MSDEDEFMPSCDSQDYDFGYSDGASDQAMEEPDDDPENLYYQSKGYRETDPETALESFAQIVAKNPGTEIALKASKQTLKLIVRGRHGPLAPAFESFLDALLSSEINQSYRDQSFMNMVEVIRGELGVAKYLEQAKVRFQASKGCERLSARTIIKLAEIHFITGDFEKSSVLLDHFGSKDLETESWRKSLALDALALRIQIEIKQGSGREEQLYDLITPGSESQMAHPRTLAVIHECGGTISIRRRRWVDARTRLLKAFQGYDEAGLPDRLRVLQYYIICSILTEIGINPFDSQETLAYKDQPQFALLRQLVSAFTDMDALKFKQALAGEGLLAAVPILHADPLAQKYLVPELHTCFQRQLLIKTLRPYSRVKFEFIARKLEIPVSQIPGLITHQILNGNLPNARLDEVNQILELAAAPLSLGAPIKPRLALPKRYQEFAAHAEQDAYEKSIIRSDTVVKKQEADLSNVYSDLLKAVDLIHTLTTQS